MTSEAQTAVFFDDVAEHMREIYPNQTNDYYKTALALSKMIHLPVTPKVLDIGCGTGSWLSALSKVYRRGDFAGIDISRAAIRIARGRMIPRCQFRVGSWNDPPAFENGPYDLITCIGNSLSYSPPATYRRLFRELGAALTPGGLFVCDTYRNWTQGFSKGSARILFRGLSTKPGRADVTLFADRSARRYLVRDVHIATYSLRKGTASVPISTYRGQCIQFKVTPVLLATKLRQAGFVAIRKIQPSDSHDLTVITVAEVER